MNVTEYYALIAQPENSDRYFELIDGELNEKLTTEERGVTVVRLGGEIYVYLKDNPLGIAYISACHEVVGDDQNCRRPDLAYMSFERSRDIVKEGSVMIMPDLCIEFKLPTDTFNLIRSKAAFYIANGTRMVWLLFPNKKMIEVYRAGEDVEVLTLEDTLDGGDVLPGFSLPLKDIFRS